MSHRLVFFFLAGIISATSVCAGEIIDINSAPLEELTKIIHIGEARGKELISLRPFYSLDDLERIKGISQGRIQDIKDQGLAWVDPDMALNQNASEPKAHPDPSADRKPLEINAEIPPPKNDLQEEISAPADIKNEDNQTNSPLPLYFGAGITAIFSGTTILILKKKSKKDYNNIEL
jgi:hypothetical protein